MLPDWDHFLEWMVANRQNEVEWLLLRAESWDAYAVSPERQARLRTLTSHCHRYAIACGVVRNGRERTKQRVARGLTHINPRAQQPAPPPRSPCRMCRLR